MTRPNVHATTMLPLFALLALLAAAGLPAATAQRPDPDVSGIGLDLYTIDTDTEGLRRLSAGGFDVAGLSEHGDGLRVSVVMRPDELDRAVADGFAPRPWRDPNGQTFRVMSALQEEEGFDVWKSFDEPGGFREQIETLAEDNPEIVQLIELGRSVQDRPIFALRVTADVHDVEEGARPAVVVSSLQHAREWITSELNRRLVHDYVAAYGDDPEITALLESTELWFMLVANPDGYEYTFTDERLWRKTLADNDGDGEITGLDGVDPNRNFPEHWGYDDEGSSPEPGSFTYRGTAPASEPETQAYLAMLDRAEPEIVVNLHSVASLILYGFGWMDQLYTADQTLYETLAGTRDAPAIEGFTPQVSADLYITNGETCDTVYGLYDALCITLELSDQGSDGGFVFPDDEALVQKEYDIVAPFVWDAAVSAKDPANPTSHLGHVPAPMTPDTFAVSHGRPQAVQVDAARELGDVTLHYSIGDGDAVTAPTVEWDGGERYGDLGDVYYRRVRGTVDGGEPGDVVTVWFEAGAEATEPFSYTIASDTERRVLVVAAEDYTGGNPEMPDADGPAHLDTHLEALAAHGVEADVYDVDANGRAAPHALGVLGHYDLVLWYTGGDIAPAPIGAEDTTASRLANEMQLEMRDYLNEGGRLLFEGKYAGYPYAQALRFDPVEDIPCVTGATGCRGLSNDLLQYWLGASSYTERATPDRTMPNLAGEGAGMYTGVGDSLDLSLERAVDLSGAEGQVVLAFEGFWEIESAWDYGHVEVSADGGATWEPQPDLDGRFTSDNLNARNLAWGLTGSDSGTVRVDLTPWAGSSVGVRFRYRTDEIFSERGWWVDDVSVTDTISDTGEARTIYATDFESGLDGWTVTGWREVPYPVPGNPRLDVVGLRAGMEGLSIELDEGQDHSAAFAPTELDRGPGGPSDGVVAALFDRAQDRPFDGEVMIRTGQSGTAFHRLTRTIDVGVSETLTLTLRTAYELGSWSDALFVEARTAGEDDWTTLPDANGHTSGDQGLNCWFQDWYDRHPQLASYMTRETGDIVQCVVGGTTGTWTAATGNSDGWEEWAIDLSAYAGSSVEVSISHVSQSQSVGASIDAVQVGEEPVESFEDGLGAWSIAGPPPGSPANAVELGRGGFEDYPAGPIVLTERTAYLGFGLEGITSEAARHDLVGRLLERLLPDARIYLPAVRKGE